MTRLRVAVAAASLLALTGCGPTNHPHLDIRNFTTDVIYGGQNKPVPALPNASLEPGFPSFIQPAMPVTPGPPRRRVAEACPQAAFSVEPAIKPTTSIVAPPVKATYVYRQSGDITFGKQRSQPLQRGFRAVDKPVDHGDGTMTYDVADVQPDQGVTVTQYLIDQRTGLAEYDGVFIVQVVNQLPDGSIDQFAPATPIRILPLPVPPADDATAFWESAGTDGVHNVTMQLQGALSTVPGRVDACGAVLGGIEVNASGRIFSPTKNVTFGTTYVIATQFGGLSIFENLKIDGFDGGPAYQGNTASCSGGAADSDDTANFATTTTFRQGVEQCPGLPLHRETEAVINSSPPAPAKK